MSSKEIEFRGIRERNLLDQTVAMSEGYSSVEQYAIDQLAKMYHELQQRVDALEQRLGKDYLPVQGDPED